MTGAINLYRIHETKYPFPKKCSITGALCEDGFDCRQCNVLLAEMMGYGMPGDGRGSDVVQFRIDTPANKMETCPFCGSTHWCDWHAGHRKHPWTTECMVCGASGPWADTEEEAKRLWNRRASE